jgi:hypothetical protein
MNDYRDIRGERDRFLTGGQLFLWNLKSRYRSKQATKIG